jgi:hypothetical protein
MDGQRKWPFIDLVKRNEESGDGRRPLSRRRGNCCWSFVLFMYYGPFSNVAKVQFFRNHQDHEFGDQEWRNHGRRAMLGRLRRYYRTQSATQPFKRAMRATHHEATYRHCLLTKSKQNRSVVTCCNYRHGTDCWGAAYLHTLAILIL